MNNIALKKYINKFQKIRTDNKNGEAPHKPVSLITLIELIQKQETPTNQIFLSPELVALYKDNWSILVTTDHSPNFLLPFFHLKGNGFYRTILKDGTEQKSLIRNFEYLSEVIQYSCFNEDLFELLIQPETSSILLKTILDRYFSDTKERYFKKHKISESYLNRIEKDFKESNVYLYNENDDTEKFLRGALFKRLVPKTYEYKCAITGMKVITMQDYNMIDACHIIPFNISKDDTVSNGISLCPNLHRAFDRGMISLDDTFTVIVSESFSEDETNNYSLRKLKGSKILLPFDKKLYPSLDKIRWHREKVFKG